MCMRGYTGGVAAIRYYPHPAKKNGNSVNSANCWNLVDQWSMNWHQFKSLVSDLCLVCVVIVSWPLRQEVAGSNPFDDKYFWWQIQWKHLGKYQMFCSLPTKMCHHVYSHWLYIMSSWIYFEVSLWLIGLKEIIWILFFCCKVEHNDWPNVNKNGFPIHK